MNGYLAWDEAAARNVIDTLKAKPGALLHEFQETFGDIAPDAEPPIADALNIARESSRRGDVLRRFSGRAARLGKGGSAADQRICLESVYRLELCFVAPPAMVDGRSTVWDSTGFDPPIREAVQLLVTQDNR